MCVLGGTWGEQKQFTAVMSRCSTSIFESEIIDRFSKITAQTYQNEYLAKNLTKGYFLNEFCLL